MLKPYEPTPRKLFFIKIKSLSLHYVIAILHQSENVHNNNNKKPNYT